MITAVRSRAELIESHLPLVVSVARRHQDASEPLEDLVQVGTIGLIKAIDRFDRERGSALSTFAVPFIEGEIRHHLRDSVPLVRVPRPLRELGARARAAHDELAARHARTPTTAEVGALLGVAADEVVRAVAARPGAALLGDAAGEPAAETADALAAGEARVLLEAGWRRLAPRERRIMQLRFFDDRSQAQIGREVGLSQAHVSRLIAATLERLRRELAGADPAVVAPRAAAYSDHAMGANDTRAEQRTTTHSGRLLVRMPQTLHAELAQAAEREGVSLNALITGTLASSVGWRDGNEDGPAPTTERPAAPGRSWTSIALAANLVVVAIAAIVAIVLLVVALGHGF
jgi:RNA polymerase sigma-B factor